MRNLSSITSIDQLQAILHLEGCRECTLGFQEGLNGVCLCRGNPSSRRMIIGEAPGKYEDSESLPFVGPAGQLLDRIFSAVSWDTNTDWYLTNVALCRPIARIGSGRENLTPKEEQISTCRPYLDKQIELIQPRIIVALGGVALSSLLGIGIKIGEYRGRLLEWNGIPLFPMLHPAYILHSSGIPDKYQEARALTWNDIQKLRQIVDELEHNEG